MIYDEEQYPGAFLKAAVIMEAIIRGHPFNDGNKRTGYLAGITLLELLNGRMVWARQEAVERMCLEVEAEQMSRDMLVRWLIRHSAPR